MKADPRVFQLHADLDSFMREVLEISASKGMPVTCSAGCWACCYEPVYVDRKEVEHALGRLTPEKRARVKERTKDWVAKLQASDLLAQEQPNVFEWRKLKAACPFLENHRCMIYTDRPAGCRMHCAVGDPQNCFDDARREHQTFIDTRALAPHSAAAFMVLDGFDYDNLGCWLADILLGVDIHGADHFKGVFI